MTESCIICLAPALHPVRLTCRCTMRACADCLFRWFYSTLTYVGVPIEKKTCPTCRRADVDALLVDEKTGDTRPLNLMEMAKRGDKELVAFMIALGAKWRVTDDDGLTPLGAAAGGGHLDLVKMLIEEWGVPVDQADSGGETPLFAACYRGATEVVKYLVSKGASPFASDKGKWYPIGVASMMGHMDIVRFLVEEAGVDPNQCLDKYQINAAMEAAGRGNLDIVRYLLETGPKRLPPGAVDKDGSNVLFNALEGGYEDVALYLLNQFGAEAGPDAKDSSERSTIFAAAGRGCLEAAKILHAKFGVPVDERDEDDSDVASAVLSSCPEDRIVPFLKWLASCGTDLTEARNDDGHLLTQQRGARALPVMQYLVDELGMSPTDAAKDGTTPLFVAVDNGCLDTVKFLESKGADSFGGVFRKLGGVNLLHAAASSLDYDTAEYVLNKGPKLNISRTNDEGETPLHTAAGASSMPCAFLQSLLRLGADATAKNNDGETALFVAAGISTYDALTRVRVLVEAGGDALVSTPSKCGETPLWKAARAVGYRRIDAQKHNARVEDARSNGAKQESTPPPRWWGPANELVDVETVASEVFLYFLNHPSATEALVFDAKNEEQETVLHALALRGDVATVQKLIAKFPKHDKTTPDEDGNHPLHIAADGGSLHMAHVLAEQFPHSAATPNKKRKYPEDLAKAAHCAEMAEFLTSARSKFNRVDSDEEKHDDDESWNDEGWANSDSDGES